MKTKVIITIDVEPSVAGAYTNPTFSPLIHEPVWGDVSGRSEALGFIIRTLDRYDLRATFFIETVHTAYFSADTMGRYVATLVEAGQDVQLHLHPTWLNFAGDRAGNDKKIGDNCHELAADVLCGLIEEGAETIENWTGRRPSAMRTGNFSTSKSVFMAMRSANLAYGSNICVAIFRPPEPELSLFGGAHDIEGVIELPVTCFSDNGPVGHGRLRPLQVTACSFAEQRAILNQLHARDGRVAIIVTHPSEFLKRSDYRFSKIRANGLVQTRFEKLCAFLAKNGDRFDTTTLASAAAAPSALETPVPLTGDPISSVFRAVQNVLNDRLF